MERVVRGDGMKPDERLIESIQHCAELDPDDHDCTICPHSEYCFYDYSDDSEGLASGRVFKGPALAKALLPMIMGVEE